MIVYAVLYNPMDMESGAYTISLHQTLLGAYKAMRKAKLEAWNAERDEYLRFGIAYPHGRGGNYCLGQWWAVEKMKVQD